VALYSGTQDYIKLNCVNKTYVSDDPLHAIEQWIYHAIKFQAEGFEGEHIFQMCQGSRSQCCGGGDWQNDWMWVNQHPGRCYAPLYGCLPWQLQQLFKIKLLNEDGAFVEYWWALTLTAIPEDFGNLDPVSECVQVRTAPTAVGLHFFSLGNIVGCAHLMPEIATSTRTGDGWNKRWIVNSHIDLVMWNDVYK